MSLNQPSTSAGKSRYEDDIALGKFNIEREHQFLFVKGIDSKPVCLICNACITVPKKFNLERHFNQMHPDFNTKYPINSELRADFISIKKTFLSNQQTFFKDASTQQESMAKVSYEISLLLVSTKNSISQKNF
jgi:hypothetical protein